MAASAIFALNSCTEDTPGEEIDGPSIEWKSNSDFSTVDITETMNVNLTIKAPAGIKSFTVKVDSEPLNNGEGLLDGFKLTELDLVNPSEETAFIVTMILGEGQTVADATELNLDLSTLVPLIAGLTTEDGYHSFTLNIVDNNAKSLEKTCRFHRIGEDTPSYAAPTAEWVGHSFDEPMELSDNMEVKININAPAGFKEFTVKIESAPLNNGIELGPGMTLKLTELDLINPDETTSAIVSMILGTQDIKTATALNLDLSKLVPMILSLNPENDSDHKFTFNVVDNADQTLSETCTFHYTGETTPTLSVDESSVDLWANTAKVTVSDASADVTYTVQYREKGTTDWYNAEGDATNGFTLAPEYDNKTNGAEITVYTVKDGSGIYAKNTYEVRLMNGETEVSTIEFTTEGGDVIPNGDMSAWSDNSRGVTAPNAEGESFWDSGNNSMTDALCVEDNDVAKLKPYALTFLSIFACGNLYTGEFDFQMPSGTANFGAEYTWNARPKAFKFKYKSTVGNIDVVGSSDPLKELEGQPDRARVYAVVVDWSERHGVASGMGVDPSSTVWDPATQTSVEGSGNILGYADLYIDTSSDEAQAAWTEGVEIPFNWYDVTTKPSGKYTLVISCTTSYRGDYLTGSSNSELYVDDFEWVY